MQTYALFDVAEHIRRVVALNFKDPVWVIAEIAQTGASRGHIYIDLIQKSDESAPDDGIVAQAQAVIWASELRKLRARFGGALEDALQEGRQIKFQSRITFHERYGLKFQIEDLDPAYTLGQLALERRKTLEQLTAEQLLQRNRQLPLPPVLQRIAVITSPDAAGLQDFNAHLRQNAWAYQFSCSYFFSAVQGLRAESELCAALEAVAARGGEFDAAVVIRGGGARTDLSAFDRLSVCRAAAMLPIPLLTGIGHETDESVLDLTAFAALKTPTAVADALIHHNAQFEAHTLQLGQMIAQIGQNAIRFAQQTIENGRIQLKSSAQNALRRQQWQIDLFQKNMPPAAQNTLDRQSRRLDDAQQLLSALSPEATLRRGYSLTLKDGKTVRSARQLQPGDVIATRWSDGEAISVIRE